MRRPPAQTIMDFDHILKGTGDFGRYQKLMYFFICLPAAFPSAWTAFNQVFVAAMPDHWCKVEGGEGGRGDNVSWLNKSEHIPMEMRDGQWVFSQCQEYSNRTANQTVHCLHGYSYNQSTYVSTIVTEFDLVCDRQHWASLCTMIFYVGSFIGNILFGYVADKWGRRASFFAILFIQTVFGTASAFAPDIYTFTVLRFLVGLSFPALYQIPFVIGMELMGPSGRIFAGMVVCVFFGTAMCLLGIVASFLREWSSITLVCNTPFIILFAYWWFLPESPRWLVVKGRPKEAAEILQTIGKFNKKPVDINLLHHQCVEVYESSLEDSHSDEEERHNLIDLFKTPNLCKKTIIITFIWLVNSLVYNGLTYNVRNLPVNDYLSFSINGAVEVPAYFLIWPLLERVGRRWPMCLSMLIGGICCIVTMFVPPSSGWIVSILAFAGKFGIASSFAILYIFAGELYPTVVRAIGMGMSSMVAGSGLILAPYLVELGNYVRILPLIIMGVLSVLAGLASMFLPETLGAPLPQSIQDAESFGADIKLFSCFSSAAPPSASASPSSASSSPSSHRNRNHQEDTKNHQVNKNHRQKSSPSSRTSHQEQQQAEEALLPNNTPLQNDQQYSSSSPSPLNSHELKQLKS